VSSNNYSFYGEDWNKRFTTLDQIKEYISNFKVCLNSPEGFYYQKWDSLLLIRERRNIKGIIYNWTIYVWNNVDAKKAIEEKVTILNNLAKLPEHGCHND